MANTKYLTFVTLVIALAGGLPGAINVYKYLIDRPQLIVHLYDVLPMQLDGQNMKTVLVSAQIANSCSKVLAPSCFRCFINNNGKWVELERFPIPPNLKLRSTTMTIASSEDFATRDLQTFVGALEYGKPVYGYFMFMINQFSAEELDKLIKQPQPFKIVCDDIYQKRYEYIPRFSFQKMPNGRIVNPKVGLTIDRDGGSVK